MPDQKRYSPVMRIWEADELNIPGLHLLGYCRFVQAIEPLSRHKHANCLEFICLLKGDDTYTVDGQTYHLRGGDIFISFPGQEHYSGDSHQGIGEYVWLQIDLSVQGDFLGLSAKNAAHLKDRLNLCQKHVLNVSPAVMRQAKSLYTIFAEKQETLYCSSQLVSFLTQISGRQDPSAYMDRRIRSAIHFIDAHLDSPLSLKDLGSRCGLSESGFKHKFRAETGYTPGDYINRQRIRRAQELLQSGCSVVRAAMDTGFNSSDYFTVVFKKYMRQTPTAYIQRRSDAL